MAQPTGINDSVSDAQAQINTTLLASAPAMAMANLYQATAQAMANAAHQATLAQQQTFIASQAATTAGVSLLLARDKASAVAASKALWNTLPKG